LLTIGAIFPSSGINSGLSGERNRCRYEEHAVHRNLIAGGRRWRRWRIAKNQPPGDRAVAIRADRHFAATRWPATELFGQEISLNLGAAAVAVVVEPGVLGRQQHV